MAHQVIFIPPERRYVRTSTIFDKEKDRPNDFDDDEYDGVFFYKKSNDYDLGTVYCFGGWNEARNSPSMKCFKYNVAKDTWKAIQGLPNPLYDFNLISISNRYIKFINNGRGGDEVGHWLYDYEIDGWHKIKIEPTSCVIVSNCQIGAFPLTLQYISEEGIIRKKQGIEHHEMIYFGGLDDPRVYKVTLFQLKEDGPWRMCVEGIDEDINVHTLLEDDRFFYNFPFYLEKPTP